MAVEAARLARRTAPDDTAVGALWFSTANPAYLDKNNASAIHAALRLDSQVGALDFGGALRSGVGALRTALDGNGCVLVIASDMRGGLPTSTDESQGGDGAAAIVVGSDADGPVIAEFLGAASATEEFIERWRAPGSDRSRAWEERFGEVKYAPLAEQAWNGALKAAELSPDQIDRLIVTGMHARAVRGIAGRLGASKAATAEDLAATVGNTGTADAALLLTNALETAEAGQVIALVVLADGVDVLLFRTTAAISSYRPAALGRHPGRERRRAHLRQVPLLARPRHLGAAAPARARTHLGIRVGAQRGVEVRVRRLPRPRERRAAPAARSRVTRRRRGRRHGEGADVGGRGNDRPVHDRPHRVLAEPADHVRGRRLRRWRPAPGGARRRRRRHPCRSATGSR